MKEHKSQTPCKRLAKEITTTSGPRPPKTFPLRDFFLYARRKWRGRVAKRNAGDRFWRPLQKDHNALTVRWNRRQINLQHKTTWSTLSRMWLLAARHCKGVNRGPRMDHASLSPTSLSWPLQSRYATFCHFKWSPTHKRSLWQVARTLLALLGWARKSLKKRSIFFLFQTYLPLTTTKILFLSSEAYTKLGLEWYNIW